MALNDYTKRINFKSPLFWALVAAVMSLTGFQISDSYFNVDFNEGSIQVTFIFEAGFKNDDND
jgi:hypothetical protein